MIIEKDGKQLFIEEIPLANGSTTYGLTCPIDKIIHHKKKDPSNAEDWEILIFDSENHGRVCTMDNTVQYTTKDEANYHEMMVHVPLIAHPAPKKKVLIIGGGDGGILREALKDPTVETVTLVDISQDMVELSKKHTPSLSNGAFDDPRAIITIMDGAKFVEETTNKYDIIITDSTDPIGPGAVLFSRKYYTDCKKCLNPDGIHVTQNGAALLQAEQLNKTHAIQSELFNVAVFYNAQVPTYPTGLMNFGLACNNPQWPQLTKEDIAQKLKERYSGLPLPKFVYYNPEVHAAAFALPQSVMNMLVNDKKTSLLAQSMVNIIGTPATAQQQQPNMSWSQYV